ncbi:hypothetical protein T07_15068 [Trichinella nelsoni]|uniref:Uncharacterized protein n=1 Tax=Trichinella nelsoni TaxID=6336 RepID=A0A0V0RKM6_9BILA|nr:hypothetical protein T07_15068 [Trichinella nelsoni]
MKGEHVVLCYAMHLSIYLWFYNLGWRFYAYYWHEFSDMLIFSIYTRLLQTNSEPKMIKE